MKPPVFKVGDVVYATSFEWLYPEGPFTVLEVDTTGGLTPLYRVPLQVGGFRWAPSRELSLTPFSFNVAKLLTEI